MKKIFINGVIYSLDEKDTTFEAMLVDDGVIVALGNREELMSKIKDEALVTYDLKGKAVYPGFNDSHMHLLGSGINMMRCGLAHCQSAEATYQTLTEYCKDNENQSYIIGRGWNEDKFLDQSMLSIDGIDHICNDKPVMLIRACGHIGICNTEALKMCNIDEHTVIEGGVFDKDDEGKLTGIVRENALDFVLSKFPLLNQSSLEDCILSACKRANECGITSVQSDDLCAVPEVMSPMVFEVFNDLDKRGLLTVKIYEQSLFRSLEIFKEAIDNGYKMDDVGKRFRRGPLKILADGSLGSRTAKLRMPYHDAEETTGIFVHSPEEIKEMIDLACANNIDVAIHGIGDATIEMALDCFEETKAKYKAFNARHSIVHCQIMDEALMDRMASLEVGAMVQPIFIDYDMHIVKDRVGEALSLTSYAYKTMSTKNIKLAFGTDAPVEPMNPMPCMDCAVNRMDLNRSKKYLENEGVSVKEALKLYTVGGSWFSRNEKKGLLKAGYTADFVVMQEDFFKVEALTIKDLEVSSTWIDGECVFKK